MVKKSFKGMIFVVLRAVFILVKVFKILFSPAYHCKNLTMSLYCQQILGACPNLGGKILLS